MSTKISLIESDKIIFKDFPKININLINNIHEYLISLIKENKKLKNCEDIMLSQENLIFNSKDYSFLSLKDYLLYVVKYYELEDYILIYALIYIERYCNETSIILTEFNIHKLLFTSILISIKQLEDFYYNNNYYSNIIGVKNKDLNKLEYNFVTKLDFKLYVNKSEYQKYKKYIEKYMLLSKLN